MCWLLSVGRSGWVMGMRSAGIRDERGVRRTRRGGVVGTAAVVSCALLLAGCSGSDEAGKPDARHRPVSMEGKGAP